MLYCSLLNFFQNQLFRKILSVSNSLDPNQARSFVKPDLGPNHLKRLSAYDTCRLSINPKCANRNKSRLLFSSAEMFKKPLMANSVDPDQTASIGAVCSGSTLFASIFKAA